MSVYRSTYFLLLCNILLTIIVDVDGLDFFSKGRLNGILNKFANCPGKDKIVKGYYQNVKWRYDSAGVLYVDFEIVYKEKFPDELTTVWTIQKCQNKDSSDSCMKFTSFRSTQFCKMMASMDPAWAGFITCIEPEWKCPFQKRIYKGRNCTLDMSQFSYFPLEGSFWKFKVELYNTRTNALLLCTDAEGSVKRVAN